MGCCIMGWDDILWGAMGQGGILRGAMGQHSVGCPSVGQGETPQGSTPWGSGSSCKQHLWVQSRQKVWGTHRWDSFGVRSPISPRPPLHLGRGCASVSPQPQAPPGHFLQCWCLAPGASASPMGVGVPGTPIVLTPAPPGRGCCSGASNRITGTHHTQCHARGCRSSTSGCPPAPVSPVPYRRRRFSRNCSMVTSSSRTKSALPNSGPSSSAMPRPLAPTSPLGCAGGFLRRQRPTEPTAQAQGDREHPLCHCHRHLLRGWRQPNLWPSTPRVDIDHHRCGWTCGVGAMGLLHPAGAPWCPQICHCTKNPVGNQLFIEMVASPVVIPVSPVKRLV